LQGAPIGAAGQKNIFKKVLSKNIFMLTKKYFCERMKIN